VPPLDGSQQRGRHPEKPARRLRDRGQRSSYASQRGPLLGDLSGTDRTCSPAADDRLLRGCSR
jgi:hypothetical protein